MLLATLAANLLRSALTGREVKRAGKGTVKWKKKFNAASSFNLF